MRKRGSFLLKIYELRTNEAEICDNLRAASLHQIFTGSYQRRCI